MFANNRDGTFAEVSGVLGLDLLEDGRSFALADLDHDGRLEVIVKNRNGPQLRVLHNSIVGIGDSVSFNLRGHKSNRDAIGAAVTVSCGPLKQTKYLQAGTGFLAQHTKEVFFGVGKPESPVNVSVRWPSGLEQQFEAVPVNYRIHLEEGVDVVQALPFGATKIYASVSAPAESLQLPTQIDTWLLVPLKAPGFTLPDVAGTMHPLKDLLGRYTLLHLWSSTAPGVREQLQILARGGASLRGAGLEVIALHLDTSADVGTARSLLKNEAPSLTALFATEETAGIYNLLFRFLFDRRRDLTLPTSFLLDGDGMIVKVYQGTVDGAQLLRDLNTVPKTAEERMERALPFPGQLAQGSFQRNDFTYGVAFFQHGYLEEAAAAFEQVVATKPNDPEAYYNLGTLNLSRKDYVSARRYLERTVQLRPDYPEAWNNIGLISAMQGSVDVAVESFQRALDQRPSYETAWMNLGNLYRRQGAFAKADECLQRAYSLQPDDPEVNYSIGMLYAQQQQLPRAAEYLSKAIVLRANYPEALNNLGIVYVRLQELDKAEQQFKEGIRVAPTNDQAYLNLARVYTMREDQTSARKVLKDLLRVEPDNAVATQALQTLQ
jgi:tetratricopeptide (TPR) repeat protein/peroxiredoxin